MNSESPVLDAEAMKAYVRGRYGEIALGAGAPSCGCGCGPASVSVGESYAAVEGYAAEADLGLGCGLPTEHAGIRPGHTVLDLGAGAGIDAFVARSLVGETGQVIGVDMTAAMVERARRNAAKLGYDNVSFRLGEIEHLPVEADTVDVAISNCVLNLVPDKARAFREIYRVLRPGAHFCISDIVSVGALPEAVRQAAELYAGCVAGALERDAYLALLEATGFQGVAVVAERAITVPDETLRAHLSPEALEAYRRSGSGLRSITVRGAKPVRA